MKATLNCQLTILYRKVVITIFQQFGCRFELQWSIISNSFSFSFEPFEKLPSVDIQLHYNFSFDTFDDEQSSHTFRYLIIISVLTEVPDTIFIATTILHYIFVIVRWWNYTQLIFIYCRHSMLIIFTVSVNWYWCFILEYLFLWYLFT